MLETAEKNTLEICSFLLKVYRPNGSHFIGSKQSFDYNTIYKGLDLVRKGIIPNSSCSCLYLRQFIEDNQLRFTEGIVHEDVEFMSRIYLLVNNLMFVDKIIYVYAWNEESTDRSTNLNKIQKNFLDDVNVAYLGVKFTKEHVFPKDIISRFEQRANSMIISKILLLLMDSHKRKLMGKEFVQRAKSFNLYPIKGKSMSRKTSLLIPIFNLPVVEKFICH